MPSPLDANAVRVMDPLLLATMAPRRRGEPSGGRDEKSFGPAFAFLRNPSHRRWPHGGAAAALVAVALVGAAAYLLSPAMATVPSPITSIAVLPFDNLSGDPAQEYFGDGMTEALIGRLAQVRALRVVSRTSVMRFKGTRPAVSDVARALDIDALIEGTVQRANGRVRISVQLIDARTDTHIWAREYRAVGGRRPEAAR